MKLTVTTDEGVVVGVIEGLEAYDLQKPFARSSLVEDIADMVKRGRVMEEANKRTCDNCGWSKGFPNDCEHDGDCLEFAAWRPK